MPPQFISKTAKLLKPDDCNVDRLFVLLFCAIISFNLLKPNTKKKNFNVQKFLKKNNE
jgi:hypothetical protein